jgi:hypothetical protein
MSDGQELVLSASSVRTWLDCGHKYLLEHVWRIPAAPNMDMAIGTAVHAGVEALHKGSPDPVEATVSAFAREYVSMGDSAPADTAGPFGEAMAMHKVYVEKIAPTFKPSIVERDFVIRVEGVLFSGRIDQADPDRDEVHDTKTVRALAKVQPERYRFQMTGYGLGYREITGRRAKRLVLDIIARNGNWKQVEVQPDETEFVDTLGIVRDGVERGEYDPTGVSSGQCARCPFLGGACVYGRVD